MPKYLYTSDLRISELAERIQSAAQKFASGSSITDKSEANNAATLQFYFNLEKGTATLNDAVADPVAVIRNYLLKFQFPNTRTPESLNDAIEQKMFIAPYRAITAILWEMLQISKASLASLSCDEILYYVFCNPSVYTNPEFNVRTLVDDIIQGREEEKDYEQLIQRDLIWNQYGRQSRELLTVLTKGCLCFTFKKGYLTLDVSNAKKEDLNFISELRTYTTFWFPSNSSDYQLAQKEFISYMDTNPTPYSVIQFKKMTNVNNVSIDTTAACRSYLSAIRTKPFLLLAGISGTGKSRIVRRLAQATTTHLLENCSEAELEANRWDIHKPENFEIIQVKPNWHNSMDLVGYQTNIPEPHYVFMPFAEFVAKAWLHPSVPFFLCLDEMNLAPVEEYFAEFLSAIESRSKRNGKYETDPIIKPFKDFGEKVCEQMIVDLFPEKNIANAAAEPLKSVIERFKTRGLTLPENLIVIGTVNMDETTFSFSRKVLDRAMSFEMNEVDYDSFLADEADIIGQPLSDAEKALLTDRTIRAQDVAADIDADAVIGYLKAVNSVLDNTPFKLGYRAANEAMLYVSASGRFGQTNVGAALDEFTLMKILSRVEGDEVKLKTMGGKSVLDELEAVIASHLGAQASEASEAQEADTAPAQQPAELKSLKKLHHMQRQLENNHFVSYWE